jgi:hypothetical protein
MSTAVLDRWEERLQDIFDGRPYDMLDAALTDTISKFPLDIKVCLEYLLDGLIPSLVYVLNLIEFFLSSHSLLGT